MSSSKRAVALMAVLLAVIAAAGAYFWPRIVGEPAPPVVQALPGQNAITNLKVDKQADGRWAVSFDYFFTGPQPVASVSVFATHTTGVPGSQDREELVDAVFPKPGPGKSTVYMRRPSGEYIGSRGVTVKMDANRVPLASAHVDAKIDWPPHWQIEMDAALASKTPQQSVDEAVKLIDTERRANLHQAKYLLERLIEKNPQLDTAYVEMARVAMKTNWGDEGLRHAEQLVGSALQIQPDSINAKILLGYVYAHQKRYKEAEALFAGVAQADAQNLWLWFNWGELYDVQGRTDQAIAKYRQAIAQPPRGDTYDRARHAVFSRLASIYRERKDWASVDAVLKQHAGEHAPSACHGLEYAEFKIERGDAQAAMDLAKQAEQGNCADVSSVRLVRGLGHYLQWAGSKGAERDESLRQARIYVPAGPALFLRLAASDQTFDVARQLVAAGERVDQQDGAKLTALAYAFRDNQLDVARRLLRLGAKTDDLVGGEQLPVALLPVLTRNFEGIKLMQKAGVDYAKLKHNGTTALDFAQAQGDRELLDALRGSKGTSL